MLIKFTVNGVTREVETDPRRPLLDVLREDLGLTGTKYGCGEGQCGACSVLIDGQRVSSCETPMERIAGASITTIEGLAQGDKLHPVQQAFLAEHAFQCGYCTPGMILGSVALLQRTPAPTEEQIVSGLGANICRCCGYPRIIKAVQRAAGGRP